MFSQANTKLKKLYKYPALQQWLENGKVYSLDLLSGWSCPFAKDCHSKVVQTDDGLRIVDGPDTEFRCYSASQEAIYTNAYKKRKANFEALKGLETDEMVTLLCDNLPKNSGVIRIHAAGDFFNQQYFNAWMKVAELNPGVLFYAYTKALPYWVHFGLDKIPENVILTASRGGRSDSMIAEHELRSVKVVFSAAEAEKLGLEIDDDDTHASDPTKRNDDFALLIHGVQPKGSEAAVALRAINREKKMASV